MKALKLKSVTIVLLGLLAPAAHTATERRPSIVMVLVDDLGWADLGCYGNRFVETPRIDRLAAEGMRFTDFYAAGPVCSPTRASIQTGQNQARFGLTDFIPGHWRPFEEVVTPQTALSLPLGLTSLAEALKAAGYTSGYFGKWHLAWGGSGGPREHGYDEAITTGGRHFAPRFRVEPPDAPAPRDGQYLAEYLTDRTLEFIERHRSRPFFAFLSHAAVHIPLEARPELVEKYREKPKPAGGVHNPVYAAMVEHCDRSVGRIVAQLDALGLSEDTIVIFTSDNGGLYRRYGEGGEVVTSNAPLRGEKGTLWEGGIRVPLIVRWPRAVRGGSVCRTPVVSHDLYPTCIEAAGGRMPEGQVVDGLSLVPLLRSPETDPGREAIYFHYPHYHHSRPASAVRAGEWKLMEYLDNGTLELYDLAHDIGEARNLAADRPETANRLRARLAAWRRGIGAAMPRRNPAFDPGRREEWWNRRRVEPVDMENLRKALDRKAPSTTGGETRQ